ncbi:SPARC-like protein 1 isoform X1 [Polypterus senegalus]|uniref:SPARC-like protein 1 isoform X1 n=2 Tax=Polypterus senegalus TaxID=55291 RepID=UPI00196659FB|nr:SPARC-like protein 1 isoform X1 [Polypterus senegalus]XP_039608647.1 SPARC-like protein 1 isoform X1 [Polypterus senegalus]XP_039608648.1 SPARC-like protein 1 isoform X1 [Polypterus senegalus]XP_039608649.1 SPARC-like protein 1 isoform X1 [Polypterus senegalus]XP_039608650.1 SPARC-like protein 1 isoform X1 [Polypterus senegalus]
MKDKLLALLIIWSALCVLGKQIHQRPHQVRAMVQNPLKVLDTEEPPGQTQRSEEKMDDVKIEDALETGLQWPQNWTNDDLLSVLKEELILESQSEEAVGSDERDLLFEGSAKQVDVGDMDVYQRRGDSVQQVGVEPLLETEDEPEMSERVENTSRNLQELEEDRGATLEENDNNVKEALRSGGEESVKRLDAVEEEKKKNRESEEGNGHQEQRDNQPTVTLEGAEEVIESDLQEGVGTTHGLAESNEKPGTSGLPSLRRKWADRKLKSSVYEVQKNRRKLGRKTSLRTPVLIKAADERPSHAEKINSLEANVAPCEHFRCKRGKTCDITENGEPRCVCQDVTLCPLAMNAFDQVCGTDNKTYDTSCHLFATKCQLEGTKKGHRLHLDYIGSCKYIAPCLDDEFVQFPLRMRDWLKNVLLQLYEQTVNGSTILNEKQRARVQKIYESQRVLRAGEGDEHPVEVLLKDFEKNYNMYIYPVHWQFAQVDQHPADRSLSRSELAPLRLPLVPMEHCISRFFTECDVDKDKLVSFQEWCRCFAIKDDDIDTSLLF